MANTDKNSDSWIDDIASKEIIFDGGVHITEEPDEENKKHWFRNRLTFALLIGLVLAIGGWLLAGIYLTQIRIGATLVTSHGSDDTLRQIIESQAANYKLQIVYPDKKKKSFSLSEVGLKVDTLKTIEQIRRTEKDFQRRLQWWHDTKITLALISNAKAVNSFIAKHAVVTIQPATSAELVIDEGEVVIKDSITGKHFGLYGPTNTLEKTVANLDPKPLKLQTLSTRPAITSRQLEPYQTKLKNILDQSVVYTIGSKTFEPSVADIAKWVEISSSDTSRSIDITVNSGLVEEYLDTISKPYLKASRDQIEFTSEDGTAIILIQGVKGTGIEGKDDVAVNTAKNLLANKSYSATLKVGAADFQTVTANAYDKWIEVDLTDKQMHLYEKSNKIKTYLVSAGAPETPTVRGQYAIYAKIEQQDMRGLNVDGTRYFQPNVAWVNYFYQDYAIHGNYWRPLSWFGRINSSHGCVSLPNIEAQWIYNWAPKGTQVIIHD